MDAFLKAIAQVGIFIICAQAVIHFRPAESYEKYMKMLVSVMILVQVLGPFVGLFGGGMGEIEERIRFFQEQMNEGMQEAYRAAREAETKLNEMSLEEIRIQAEQGEEGQEEEEEKPFARTEENLKKEDKILIDRIEIKLGGTDEQDLEKTEKYH